jgi:CRISPR-associated endonuclease Cas2
MYKLLFYDIENDKIRTRLAKKLEELGMVRLQYSVFLGSGTAIYWGKALEKIEKISVHFNTATDSCCILTIDEKQIKAMPIFGNQAILNNFVIENPAYIIV